VRIAHGLAVAALALLGPASTASGQTVVELRGSSTRYRFVDLNHTFGNKLLLDLLYIGVPGMNELYVGAGYAWSPSRSFSLTPILYGVVGKGNRERGVVLSALLTGQAGRFKVLGFGGRFFRTSGDVPSYDFVDSLDLTAALGAWEAGASLGLFHQEGASSILVGPTLKRNDSRGAWGLSLRGGDDTEVRLIRVITF
jgi:hypothetical protein